MNTKNKWVLWSSIILLIQYLSTTQIIIRIGEYDINLRDIVVLATIAILSYQLVTAVQSGKIDLIGAGQLGAELIEIYRDPTKLANHVFATQTIEPVFPIGTKILCEKYKWNLHEQQIISKKYRPRFFILLCVCIGIIAILITGGVLRL